MGRFSIVVIFGLGAASCVDAYEATSSPESSDVSSGSGVTSGGADAEAVSGACTSVGDKIDVSAVRGTTPSIAWGGGKYVIAFNARDGATDEVRVAIVDPEAGAVGEHVVASVGGDHSLPSVHATQNGFIVLWQHDAQGVRLIRARSLGADGVPVGSMVELGTSDAAEARPTATVVPGGLAVAWMEQQGARTGLFNGQSMGPTMAMPSARYPALAARGDEIGVAWSSGEELHFGRTTQMPVGAMAASTVRSASGEARLPRIALTPSGDALVAWEDTRSSVERIYLERIDAAGATSPELRVEDEEGSANWPDIASMGDRTAVVYYQYRGGPSAIYLALYDAALTREGEGIKLSGKNARFPSLTWTGKELAITWALKDGGIEMRRLTCP